MLEFYQAICSNCERCHTANVTVVGLAMRAPTTESHCRALKFSNKQNYLLDLDATSPLLNFNLTAKTIVGKFNSKLHQTISPTWVKRHACPKLMPICFAAATMSLSFGTDFNLPAISLSGTATTLLFTRATILP